MTSIGIKRRDAVLSGGVGLDGTSKAGTGAGDGDGCIAQGDGASQVKRDVDHVIPPDEEFGGWVGKDGGLEKAMEVADCICKNREERAKRDRDGQP